LTTSGSPRGTVLIGATIGTLLGLILLVGLIYLLFIYRRAESSELDMEPEPEMSVSEMTFEEDLMVHDYDNPLSCPDSSSSAFDNQIDEVFADAPNEGVVV
jgi:hypothetical protein